jgi:seryl-tRNA synthetase
MIDIKFLRENPEIVKQNIKNKFQEHKLHLVDEVIELDAQARAAQQEADELRSKKNKIAKQIGALMGQGKKEEAEAVKAEVAGISARLAELEPEEKALQEKVTQIMMNIPNIIDPSVPIGKDDSSRSRSLASRSFLILRFHIIQISWNALTALILRALERLLETASTI